MLDHRLYYQAALLALKHVEARLPTNRRFGAEADALWAQFQGELNIADRIDILLRDADGQWPGAFGARTVFNVAGAAEDDAFGASWSPLEGMVAEEMWRKLGAVNCETIEDTLRQIAGTWGIDLNPAPIEPVGAAEQLVVAGPSAIAALVQNFAGKSELNWADQVTVVATPPSHRQLAAVAGALLGLSVPSRLVAASGARAATTTKPQLVLSPDATETDAQWAKVLTGHVNA